MIVAKATGRRTKTPPLTDRASFARAIETDAAGKAPHAVRLWRAGLNTTSKGDLNFTPRSAKLWMDACAKRGNPLVFDYEHESLLPLEKQGTSPMKGAASAPHSVPEIRNDEQGRPEAWAKDIEWTDEARRQIESGERRQISPVSDFDTATREIIDIVGAALCREGATHHGTILATLAGRETGMEELIQQMKQAIEAEDWAALDALADQAMAMEGGVGAAEMAKAMVKAGKGKPPVVVPPAEETATKKLAATGGRDVLAATLDELRAATKDSKRATVEMLVATNRDLFDAVDEREHVAGADPVATRRHIASVARKVAAGALAAAKETLAATAAKPPKGGGVRVDETYGLNAIELGVAAQHNIPPKDFAASKERNARPGKGS